MSFPSQTGPQSPCYLLSPRLQSSPYFQSSPTQSGGSPSSRLSEPISIKIPKRQLFPHLSQESQDSGFSGSPTTTTIPYMRQRSCYHQQQQNATIIYENEDESTSSENINSAVFQFDEEIVQDELLLKTYSSSTRRASLYPEYSSSPVHQQPTPNKRAFNLKLSSNTCLLYTSPSPRDS